MRSFIFKSYYDIQIKIEEEGIGIIIEVKYAEGGDLDAACAEALDQINKNNYTAELKENDMHKILKHGIACRSKLPQNGFKNLYFPIKKPPVDKKHTDSFL